MEPENPFHLARYLSIEENILETLERFAQTVESERGPAGGLRTLFPDLRSQAHWMVSSCLDHGNKEDTTLDIFGSIGLSTLHSLVSKGDVRCLPARSQGCSSLETSWNNCLATLSRC